MTRFLSVARRGPAVAASWALALIVAGCASAPLRPMASAPRPTCTDEVFPIYFAEGSDALTPTAAQVIGVQASLVHGCRIGYVSVLGLTDAGGGAAQNLDLSRRRATAVARALAAAGLPAPRFEVSGAGETGAVSDSGKPVPLRRKTEVVIHALPG